MPAGRPPLDHAPRSCRVAVRLTPDDLARLDDARLPNESRNQAVIRILRRAMDETERLTTPQPDPV